VVEEVLCQGRSDLQLPPAWSTRWLFWHFAFGTAVAAQEEDHAAISDAERHGDVLWPSPQRTDFAYLSKGKLDHTLTIEC
jgi:NADH:ubiquinone oxidoreductase subunit B-like Fe-S oxidoreductase